MEEEQLLPKKSFRARERGKRPQIFLSLHPLISCRCLTVSQTSTPAILRIKETPVRVSSLATQRQVGKGHQMCPGGPTGPESAHLFISLSRLQFSLKVFPHSLAGSKFQEFHTGLCVRGDDREWEEVLWFICICPQRLLVSLPRATTYSNMLLCTMCPQMGWLCPTLMNLPFSSRRLQHHTWRQSICLMSQTVLLSLTHYQSFVFRVLQQIYDISRLKV